jgi:lipopolysaccharide transport system permease protein
MTPSDSIVAVNRRSPATPLAAVRSFVAHFGLIVQMTRREVVGRYRGSIMGLAWSFFSPLLMLAIYTFVFSVVFKTRWPGLGAEQSKMDFAILFFSGLIIYGIFAECVNRAPSIILQNVNYVKKVVFPLEILPWVACGSALFHAGVSVLVLLAAHLIFAGGIPWTAIFFPVLMIPLVLGTMGVAWLLSALGVYMRDIGQVTGMLTTILLFLSPIFFPMSAMPAEFRSWIALNPLVYFLESGRDALVFGIAPDPLKFAIALIVGAVLAWLGFASFQKMRNGFSDVL